MIRVISLTAILGLSLLSLNTSDSVFICPTEGCDYLHKIDDPQLISGGMFGSYLFNINEDCKLKALIDGDLNIEQGEKNHSCYYKITLENQKYKIVYFALDSISITNDSTVKKGDIIGQIENGENLAVKILREDRYFDPKFECQVNE